MTLTAMAGVQACGLPDGLKYSLQETRLFCTTACTAMFNKEEFVNMYNKITILADTGFIVNHLSMNGYDFDVAGQNLYITEEQTSCVETILHDNHIRYKKDDEDLSFLTERGIVSISAYYKDSSEAREDGFYYAFKEGDITLYSKCLDDRGLYHTFAIVGA